MLRLRIVWRKGRDKADTLSCWREDGSCTWSSLPPNFIVHDFTHYAVETELQLRDGFFGLLAQGWEISQFGAPDANGQKPVIPEPAIQTEFIVGLLQALPEETSAAQFMTQLFAACPLGVPAQFNEKHLPDIRNCVRQLQHEWNRVPPNDVLERVFEV